MDKIIYQEIDSYSYPNIFGLSEESLQYLIGQSVSSPNFTYSYINFYPNNISIKLALYSIDLAFSSISLNSREIILYREFIENIKRFLKEELLLVNFEFAINYFSDNFLKWATYYLFSAINEYINEKERFNYNISWAISQAVNSNIIIKSSVIKYFKVFSRTIRQFNLPHHNNSFYEAILKEIINSDIDKIKLVDLSQLKDLCEEYYNIEIDLNLFDKRVIIETIRNEYGKFTNRIDLFNSN